MIESGYYPEGAEHNVNAPWNEKSNPKKKEVEVTVSITLSKTVKIEVDDYRIEAGTDEDGNNYIDYDFSDCDLKSAVKDQIPLPSIGFKDWTEDDFEVILE